LPVPEGGTLKGRPNAETVERHIARAFGRQAALDAHGIHVALQGSTAVLTGKVSSLAEERIARNAAFAAPGIRTIESDLIVEA
jgi:osmotically-inducible protein OsmY